MCNHSKTDIRTSGARFSKVPNVLSILLGTIVIVGVTTAGLIPREAPKRKTPEKISENRPAVKPVQQLQHPVILPRPPTEPAKPAAETPVDEIKKLNTVQPLKPRARITVSERQEPKRMTPRILLKRDEFASTLITPDANKVKQPLRPLKPTVSSIRKQERSKLEIKLLKPRTKYSNLQPIRPTQPASTGGTRRKRMTPSVAGQGVTAADNKNYKRAIDKGRVLLRMLEHGRGPTIDIAWPETSRQRTLLFQSLRDCYGMATSLLVNEQNLYSMAGPAGHPWKLNSDKFSGLLRSPIGQPIPEESRIYLKIAARHNLSQWQAVRVFPRTVDAVLLSGLQKLIGENYAMVSRIRAHYVLEDGGTVTLNRIAVDGHKISGSVKLGPLINSGCRA